MSKKKTNPNKVPISGDSVDSQKIIIDFIGKMVLTAWLLVLGALADFVETTSKSIESLWMEVNAFADIVHDSNHVTKSMKYLKTITGVSIPYEHLLTKQIRTKGDLDKFTQHAKKNALYIALAVIAGAIAEKALLSEEDSSLVFCKAFDLNDEILEKRISLSDIQNMLADEYSIYLYEVNGQVKLSIHSTPREIDN